MCLYITMCLNRHRNGPILERNGRRTEDGRGIGALRGEAVNVRVVKLVSLNDAGKKNEVGSRIEKNGMREDR